MSDMPCKQVILVRIDLKLPKGKLSVQVAHASLEAALKSSRSVMDEWRSDGGKKVVLKVADLDELKKYEVLARKEKLVAALITDAGHTAIPAGTVTCLGIGPDNEEKIDRVTGQLKIL
ncbi:peptidyl-tRNA hydrolase [Candidatus Woesearchaeota archaeon]|nr:peptidyl-tRNA hydrolase [Candidatus Woesearchaeota archaeon]